MDYEFFFDDFAQALAVFSTGHEAIATVFNLEINTVELTSVLLEKIAQLENKHLNQYHFQGKEFQLRLSKEGAEVLANSLGYDVYEELPESTELYDQELQAECGLLDFQHALEEWQNFIANKGST